MLRQSRWECYCFVFASVWQVVALFLQWTLAQLFPAAWAGNTGLCSAYLSLMSMGNTKAMKNTANFGVSTKFCY
jgi:hypothetical protein